PVGRANHRQRYSSSELQGDSGLRHSYRVSHNPERPPILARAVRRRADQRGFPDRHVRPGPLERHSDSEVAIMNQRLLLLAALFAVEASAQGRVQRPMTFDDFAAVRNVGDPQVSPDGKWVLYSVRTTDVGANRRTTVTKLQPTAGGAARIFPDSDARAAEARWSPDGRRVAYTANGQLWVADVNGANARQITNVNGGAPVVITAGNRGADQNPVYSPDGRTILYASQARPGFESDRQRLMAYDRATRTSRELLPNWDRNADAYAFSPSGDAIYLSTVDASRTKLYRITRTSSGWSTGPQLLTSGGNNFSPSISPDGKTIAWLQDATERPAEVYVASVGLSGLGNVRRLTHENDPLLAQLKLYPIQDFWFEGADGESVQGLLLKPPQYQAGKKYPVLFLIHGGPQGEWLDQWHGRGNFEMFAALGFAVVAINPPA